jgi:hypothetical protein
MDKESLFMTLNDRNYFLKNYLQDNLPRVYYRRTFKKKIENADYIQAYKLSDSYKNAIHDFWRPYEKVHLIWHQAFSAIHEEEDVRYIPEDVFYKKIEPTLNRFELAQPYVDKNMTDILFQEFKRPQTVMRNINGNYYDVDYEMIFDEDALTRIQHVAEEHKIVIKPSLDSGAGKNVRVLDYRGRGARAIENDVKKLCKHYKEDFIVQKFLYQHDLFHQMHEDSLNTMRIITLRFDKAIYILSRVVRMGNHGSFTDNAKTGCITSGFNAKGELQSFATNHWTFEKYEKHPYSHFVFKNTILPGVDEALSLVKKAHEKLMYFDLVSWDIAIDRSEKPHLIEIGVNIQDINYHQRTTGPLFGHLTEDVLRQVYHPQ